MMLKTDICPVHIDGNLPCCTTDDEELCVYLESAASRRLIFDPMTPDGKFARQSEKFWEDLIRTPTTNHIVPRLPTTGEKRRQWGRMYLPGGEAAQTTTRTRTTTAMTNQFDFDGFPF
jgi:hypothetical protein